MKPIEHYTKNPEVIQYNSHWFEMAKKCEARFPLHGVAITTPDGVVHSDGYGGNHTSLLEKLINGKDGSPQYDYFGIRNKTIEGFVDTQGTFYPRYDAIGVALKFDQIKPVYLNRYFNGLNSHMLNWAKV